jgi:hypothetical protein
LIPAGKPFGMFISAMSIDDVLEIGTRVNRFYDLGEDTDTFVRHMILRFVVSFCSLHLKYHFPEFLFWTDVK